MTIAVTMCKLFTAMVLGFILNKKGIMGEAVSKKISAMIVHVTSPFLIVSSVVSVQGTEVGEVAGLLGMGVLFYAAFVVLGLVLVRILPVKPDLRGIYACMIIFSNNAFMGFPVLQALLGEETVFYATVFHLPFNLLFFSMGLYLIKKDAGLEEKGEFSIKSLINNGIIAAIAALLIFFAGIPLPRLVTEPLSFIGGVTMPLSMMVIGSSIAGYSIKEVFSQKMVYAFTVIRLVCLPLAAYFGICLLTDNPLFIGTVTITVGMPVASLVAMGSTEYARQGEAASIGVAFSTLCSMITIPVMAVLLGIG